MIMRLNIKADLGLLEDLRLLELVLKLFGGRSPLMGL